MFSVVCYVFDIDVFESEFMDEDGARISEELVSIQTPKPHRELWVTTSINK